MPYNFDTLTNRYETNSMKWDVSEDVLPMWVADMDFQTAPVVTEAIAEKVAKGIYGYTIVPDDWYDAYATWWQDRHGLRMDPEGLMFVTGVVPAISSMVRKLTTVGEQVLIQSPVYNIFYNSIRNNGRVILESPLAYQDGVYGMDFKDLEAKLAEPQTTLMILCNPHNPVGEVWSKETLIRVGDLCAKYHVTVISDEIHCDLVLNGSDYVPFASASPTCADISVTCMAPSKAFNLAGLQSAGLYVENPNLRHKVWRGINTDEVAEPNAFAIEAAIAAWTKGGPWLDDLKTYLWDNKQVASDYIASHIPELQVVPGNATYLMWIDCGGITRDTKELCDFLKSDVGLYISYGGSYGTTGESFIRINLACPRQRLEDGFKRLKTGINHYMTQRGGQ